MADLAGFGVTYNPGGLAEPNNSNAPTQLFAWQICLAHMDEGYLEDADNYADYAINHDRITQALGLGMANGQNALPLNGQMFAVAVSIQEDGEIKLIDSSYPHYNDVALIIAEQLLQGKDHGMVALLPNGSLVPFIPPTDAENL